MTFVLMKCERETGERKLSSKEEESLRLSVGHRAEARIRLKDLARDLESIGVPSAGGC